MTSVSTRDATPQNSRLMDAASCGEVDNIRYALEDGASIDAKDTLGRNALHLAARNCHTLAVKYLCSQGASIYKTDNEGWNVLHLVATSGNVDMVKYILDQDRGISAWKRWIFEGNILFRKTNCNDTLLHLAAKNRHDGAKIIKLLRQRTLRLDLNAKNSYGDTPMHEGAWYCHTLAVKYLCSQGASIYKRNNIGFDVLQMAVLGGNAEIVRCILDRNEKTSRIFQKTRRKFTLLHLAAKNHHDGAKIIKVLRQHAPKLDLNAKDLYGDTPMHKAARLGYTDIIEELLLQKAQIDKKNNLGNTPLCKAALSSQLRAAKALCDAGANINVTNNSGRTPYQLACLQYSYWQRRKESPKEWLAARTEEARETMEFLRDHPKRKK